MDSEALIEMRWHFRVGERPRVRPGEVAQQHYADRSYNAARLGEWTTVDSGSTHRMRRDQTTQFSPPYTTLSAADYARMTIAPSGSTVPAVFEHNQVRVASFEWVDSNRWVIEEFQNGEWFWRLEYRTVMPRYPSEDAVTVAVLPHIEVALAHLDGEVIDVPGAVLALASARREIVLAVLARTRYRCCGGSSGPAMVLP